jgi:hypothetical protein
MVSIARGDSSNFGRKANLVELGDVVKRDIPDIFPEPILDH